MTAIDHDAWVVKGTFESIMEQIEEASEME
jgi:hypothetical protein